MKVEVRVDELEMVDWRGFDEIALRDSVHGVTVAIYQVKRARRADPVRLVVKVRDATNSETQRHVKIALRASDLEPGWLV